MRTLKNTMRRFCPLQRTQPFRHSGSIPHSIHSSDDLHKYISFYHINLMLNGENSFSLLISILFCTVPISILFCNVPISIPFCTVPISILFCTVPISILFCTYQFLSCFVLNQFLPCFVLYQLLQLPRAHTYIPVVHDKLDSKPEAKPVHSVHNTKHQTAR